MADTRRLPGPQLTQWDWQLAAACRGMASTTFFHPRTNGDQPGRTASTRHKRSAGRAQCSNSVWITPSKSRSRTESGVDYPRTNAPNDSVFNPSDTPPASHPHEPNHIPRARDITNGPGSGPCLSARSPPWAAAPGSPARRLEPAASNRIPHGCNMSYCQQHGAVTCSRSRRVCGLISARRRYWVLPGRTGSSDRTRHTERTEGFATAGGAAGTVRSSGRSRTAGRRARRRRRVAGGSRSPPPGSGLRRAVPGWWRPGSGCPVRTELRP